MYSSKILKRNFVKKRYINSGKSTPGYKPAFRINNDLPHTETIDLIDLTDNMTKTAEVQNQRNDFKKKLENNGHTCVFKKQSYPAQIVWCNREPCVNYDSYDQYLKCFLCENELKCNDCHLKYLYEHMGKNSFEWTYYYEPGISNKKFRVYTSTSGNFKCYCLDLDGEIHYDRLNSWIRAIGKFSIENIIIKNSVLVNISGLTAKKLKHLKSHLQKFDHIENLEIQIYRIYAKSKYIKSE